MSNEKEAQAMEIFERLLELPVAQQPEFLETACGEDSALRARVEVLLQADREVTGLSTGGALKVPRQPPESVGAYRLGELLGHGGMGSVFSGERVDGNFEQRVAIKLLDLPLSERLAESFRLRFANERQILASLNHPNIATLFDGGSLDDGTPYLIMELVEGKHITQALAGRSEREVLSTFCEVCDAVEAAHRSLIVHRDIKPSNVLVTPEGSVKLLDFGIAKVLEASVDSEPQTIAYPAITPQYASPEQLRGERVTTSTDVFSLGMLLFELLAGEPPYSVTGLNTGQTISMLEREGVRQLPHEVRDLRAIVAKATQVDPSRRYRSAAELRADLQRYLAHQPVLARPDSVAYRTGRFFRRNALASSLGVVALLTLVAGLVGTSLALQQARAETRRAQALTGFLENLLLAPGSYRYGDIRLRPDARMSEVILAAVEQVPASFADDPETFVSLMSSIGITLYGMGRPAAALDAVQQALQRARTDLPTDARAQTDARLAYAIIVAESGDTGAQREIIQAVEEYQALAERNFGPNSKEAGIGWILKAQLTPDVPESLSMLKKGEAIYLDSGGDPDGPVMGWRWLAEARVLLGSDPAAMEAPAQKSLTYFTRPDGGYDLMGAYAVQLLAYASVQRGDLATAEQRFQETIDAWLDLGLERYAVVPLSFMGMIAMGAGRFDEAQTRVEEARKRLEAVEPNRGHQFYGQLILNEIRLMLRRGDYAAAARWGEHQLADFEAAGGTEVSALYIPGRIALAYCSLGRSRKCEEYAQRERADYQRFRSGQLLKELLDNFERDLEAARQSFNTRAAEGGDQSDSVEA